MEPDDVPHIANKSVNWAFRANVSPLTIKDSLLQLPKNLWVQPSPKVEKVGPILLGLVQYSTVQYSTVQYSPVKS